MKEVLEIEEGKTSEGEKTEYNKNNKKKEIRTEDKLEEGVTGERYITS